MSRGLVGMALVLGLLAGCQREDSPPPPAPAAAGAGAAAAAGEDVAPAPPPAPESPAAPAPPAAGAASGQTVGGDGSQIVLSPLSAAEVQAAGLPGELACTFVADEEGLLLVARGDVGTVEAARGVVKVGTVVETVAAPGGFNAMLRGTRFHGAGKTIEIVLTGPATGGGESPPSPARLAYDRADGARREFAGRWECGP